MENSTLIAELIARIVHMMETSYDVDRVLDDTGLIGPGRHAVEKALVSLSGAVTATKGSGSLPTEHEAG